MRGARVPEGAHTAPCPWGPSGSRSGDSDPPTADRVLPSGDQMSRTRGEPALPEGDPKGRCQTADEGVDVPPCAIAEGRGRRGSAEPGGELAAELRWVAAGQAGQPDATPLTLLTQRDGALQLKMRIDTSALPVDADAKLWDVGRKHCAFLIGSSKPTHVQLDEVHLVLDEFGS